MNRLLTFPSKSKVNAATSSVAFLLLDVKTNVFACVIARDFNNNGINFSFKGRENVEKVNVLGEVLINLLRHIPNGVVLFFASYGLLESSLGIWQKSDIFARMADIKPSSPYF